jgi:hypothetical protein
VEWITDDRLAKAAFERIVTVSANANRVEIMRSPILGARSGRLLASDSFAPDAAVPSVLLLERL